MIDPENEIDQFEDEEINPERIEAMQQACNIFAQVSRMVPQLAPRDENDMDEIVNGILGRNGDLTDSMSYTLEWRAIREKRQEASQREAELEAREQAHKNEVANYKRPSAHDLPALQADMKSRQPQAQPRPVPDDLSHLTAEEFDNTPDSELRRRMGADTRVEDRQTRFSRLSAAETLSALILEGKTNRAGIRKVRSIKLSDEELMAREERSRILEQDKAERRKLEQAWRKK